MSVNQAHSPVLVILGASCSTDHQCPSLAGQDAVAKTEVATCGFSTAQVVQHVGSTLMGSQQHLQLCSISPTGAVPRSSAATLPWDSGSAQHQVQWCKFPIVGVISTRSSGATFSRFLLECWWCDFSNRWSALHRKCPTCRLMMDHFTGTRTNREKFLVATVATFVNLQYNSCSNGVLLQFQQWLQRKTFAVATVAPMVTIRNTKLQQLFFLVASGMRRVGPKTQHAQSGAQVDPVNNAKAIVAGVDCFCT